MSEHLFCETLLTEEDQDDESYIKSLQREMGAQRPDPYLANCLVEQPPTPQGREEVTPAVTV